MIRDLATFYKILTFLELGLHALLHKIMMEEIF